MTRTFRLTRRAEKSLTAIARWTLDTFGPGQMEIYEAELLSRCQAIVNGEAHSRSCSILVEEAEDLRYLRAGEHFIVFLEQPDEIIVVDFLHARSELPRHIAALSALKRSDDI